MTDPILAGDREPIGAVLRIGEKGPSGAPTLNDRFFIVAPDVATREVKGRTVEYRPELPEFASYNVRSRKDGITTFRGELIAASVDECWTYERRAYRLDGKWPSHPKRRPACFTPNPMNPGVALRYHGEGKGDGEPDDGYREIECPGRLCEFSQPDAKGNRACSVRAHLLFRPRWGSGGEREGYPSPAMAWYTSSWNSAENVLAMFVEFDTKAKMIGLPGLYDWRTLDGEACDPKAKGALPIPFGPGWSTPLLGVPFLLSLQRKRQPSLGRSFPVVRATIDGNLANILAASRASAELAGGSIRYLEAPQPEAVDVAYDEISGGVPGSVAEVEEGNGDEQGDLPL